MTAPIKVTKLAHVGLAPKDLDKSAAFYTERWGLEPIDEHGHKKFLRAEGPEHHILTLTEGGGGLDHFAFHVASADEIDRAADVLAEKGVEIVTPPTKELEPGVAKALRFKDPEGNVVELVAGVDTVNDPYGPRDVKPQALNQVADFMTFWRCDTNHHSLALAQSHEGKTGLHHAAFELKDWEEFMRAVFWMGERRIQRMWGPGRHVAGNNLFSYYFDPEGNVVEYTAEV